MPPRPLPTARASLGEGSQAPSIGFTEALDELEHRALLGLLGPGEGGLAAILAQAIRHDDDALETALRACRDPDRPAEIRATLLRALAASGEDRGRSEVFAQASAGAPGAVEALADLAADPDEALDLLERLLLDPALAPASARSLVAIASRHAETLGDRVLATFECRVGGDPAFDQAVLAAIAGEGLGHACRRTVLHLCRVAEETTRRAAFAALSMREDDEAQALVIVTLQADPSALVRAASARAARNWRDAASAAALARCSTGDTDPTVRTAALTSLIGRMSRDRVAHECVRSLALAGTDPEVRSTAAWVLSRQVR